MNGGFTLSKSTAPVVAEMVRQFRNDGNGGYDQDQIPQLPKVGIPQFSYLKIVSEKLYTGDEGTIVNKYYYKAKTLSVNPQHNFSENFTEEDNYVLVYPLNQMDNGSMPEGSIILGYRGGYDTETVAATSYGNTIRRPWFVPVVQFAEVEIVECIEFSMKPVTFEPSGNNVGFNGWAFDALPMMRKRTVLVVSLQDSQSCREISPTNCQCGDINENLAISLMPVTVNGRTATFTGFVSSDTTASNYPVWVYVEGQNTASGNTDSQGNYTISNTYSPGTHRARAKTEDPAGNVAWSIDQEFTIEGDGDGNNDGYTLTVVGGTGTPASPHNAGEVVNISATIPSGQTFVNWTTPDGGTFGNANSANTTYTMPGDDATVTANFNTGPTTYTITFINATGNAGPHPAGAVVQVTQNVPSGQTFTNFSSSNGGTFANANQSPTNFTMPASNTTVTANSQSTPPPTYQLTVVSGTGSGPYSAGTTVNISANPPGMGLTFLNWTSSVPGIVANPNSANTTVAMPASAATVTANYQGGINPPPPPGNQNPVIAVYNVTKAAGSITVAGTVTDDGAVAGMTITVNVSYSGVVGFFTDSFTMTTGAGGVFSQTITFANVPGMGSIPLPAGRYTFAAVAGPDFGTGAGGLFSTGVSQSINYP